MRKQLLLLCTILLIAVGNNSASQAPSQGKDIYRPVATIKDIMVTMVDPSADYMWEAISTQISPAGIVQRRPQSDKEWTELRKQTLLLIEATNLLSMPGRPVTKAGEKSKNPPIELEPEQIEVLLGRDWAGWVNLSQGLRDVAVQALVAVDARDVSGFLDAGARIDQACENCHVKYWYPSTKR